MVLVRLSLALALATALIAVPAAAQTVDTEAPTVDAVVALQTEVLLLVELDAFETVPPALRQVHRQWVEYTDGFTRDGLLRWLYEADADGAAALDRLIADGVRPTPAMATALGLIDSSDRVVLESAGQITIPPAEYAVALGNLEAAAVGATRETPVAIGEDTESDRLQTVGSVPTHSTTAAVASAPTGAATGPAVDYPWVAVTTALLAVLIVGMLMIIAGRRRSISPRSRSRNSFDRLLDAGRLMTSALDRREVSAIAVSEAVALADARLGAFIDVRSGRLRLGHETGELVDDRRLDDGLLARVAATGRVVRVVSNDEPSITALPAAILAVPVIAEGMVTGIVLLVRPEDAPFSDDDEGVVGRLAPMIGSALAAADAHGDIAELTRIDSLTGLGNRRCLDTDLANALLDRREGTMLGVVMIDVDHFKHFNDTNGHGAGDQALRAVADALRAHIRSGDSAYRYGGEEFSLLLRDVTQEHAFEVIERVRASVEALAIPGADLQPGGALTISAGVALVAGGEIDEVIAAADVALYEAKAQGRNRVVIAPARVPA